MPYEIGKINHEILLRPIAAAEDALARLDERVARSEVGSGFAARADFFESVSSMWVAGELVHLEDLVLHDAQMDIRAPSHELVIAHRIVRARRLSAQTMANIRQNLFFAFAYNTAGVPLAAGVLYPFLGILLSPMFAAAAMSLSSVSVIANALRLKRSRA